jgi:hypothetical protein
MNNKRSTSHLLPEIGQPVLRALKILAPHFKEIREMWNRSMVTLDPDLDAIDLDELACVILEAHSETLNTGNVSAYRVELARCGQSLDRRGVSPIQAMIASSLYLESCCAVLFNLNIRDVALPMALAQLNSTCSRDSAGRSVSRSVPASTWAACCPSSMSRNRATSAVLPQRRSVPALMTLTFEMLRRRCWRRRSPSEIDA